MSEESDLAGRAERRAVDEVRDDTGLRDIDRMAAGLVDGLRTGAVRHHALGGNRDHMIVGRDQIPGGLPTDASAATSLASAIASP